MKGFRILLFLFVLAALAGCGQNSNTVKFSENDLALQVAGHDYQCRAEIGTIIAGLGEGYEYAEGKSCAYDGLDKTFIFPEATFYTNPFPEGDLINEIYTESAEVSTARGIAVGAAKADVLAAYGEPAEDTDTLLLYRMSDEIGQPSLCFELENDIVTAIYLTLEQV